MSRLVICIQLMLIALSSAIAQNGVFDVRLKQNKVDCNNRKILVDVELKAHDESTEFLLGNANFRFLYDAQFLQHPVLLEQHNFSSAGTIVNTNYNAQSLNGSFERTAKGIVSLNVIHSGEDRNATRVVSNQWMPVATIQFDMADVNSQKGTEITWNDNKTFPVTGLSEVVPSKSATSGSELVAKSGGIFQNLIINSFADICSASGAAEQGELMIPEGFSPNGDGVNDFFKIYNLGSLKADVTIYNRDGRLVYTNANYQNDWDGRTEQGALPGGTYFYAIRLSDGRAFQRAMTINR